MKTGNILAQIGNTPTVFYKTINNCQIYLKLEMFSPAGSIKDRIAVKMVELALQNNPNTKGFVEATSGNTGIGLAFVCSYYHLPLVIFIPESMSKERISLLKAYGAQVVLTEASLGMSGAIEKAKKYADQHQYLYLDQFHNQANVLAHEERTAKEIGRDLPNITTLVSGIGTGGTITGIAKGLSHLVPRLRVIGVEPEESPVISKGYHGAHGLQGIGAGFYPPLLKEELIDEIVTISTRDGIKKTQCLAKEGYLLGLSSGAAVLAGERVAESSLKPEIILVICPDGGLKYLSTGVYDEK